MSTRSRKRRNRPSAEGALPRTGHVARTGAVAVALGIGAAIVTSPGVAWADDPEPSTPPNSTSAESSTDSEPNLLESTPTPTESGSSTGPALPRALGALPSTLDRFTSSSENVIRRLGVIVRSSGGFHAPDRRPAGRPTDELAGGDDPSEELDAEEPAPSKSKSALPKIEGLQVDPSAVSDPIDAVVRQHAEVTKAFDAVTSSGAQVLQSLSIREVETPALFGAMQATASPLHAPVETPEESNPLDEVTVCLCGALNQVFSVVSTIGNAIAPILLGIVNTPAPEDPSENPLLWAVVGWVRRQTDEVLTLPPVVEAISTATSIGQQLYTAVLTCGRPATELPAEFERTVVVSGLEEPTDFRFLPVPEGSNERVIIAEKTGAIRVYELSDTPTEPVTITVLPTRSESEKGLTGIELDPDLTVDEHGVINGYVYVAYTGADNHDRLSRLTIVNNAVTEETEIMYSPEEAGLIHHGGELAIGPDGMLYWGTGDNSLSTNAQDLTNIHGKIMRIDPETLEAPPDNPFVGVTLDDGSTPVPEIYAYGFRNPFRFTFAPDGQMLVGDVGNTAWEELNVVVPGGNYGWPGAEGTCTNCGYVNPIYTYAHLPEQSNAGSITSVLVYDATGEGFSDEYQGKVFIADYTLGWVKVLTFDDDYTTLISEQTFDSDAGTAVKLLQGPDGNIYQLNIYPGELSRIAPSDGNRAPTAVITSSPTNGSSPLVVEFFGQDSTDPEGVPLTYHWDFGDGTTSTQANPTKTFTTPTGEPVHYDVTLTVSDGVHTDQTTQRITVGSTAPVAKITSPVTNSKYDAGDVITFTGTGEDAEDDPSELQYEWTVVFHHAEHVHPFEQGIDGPSGSVTIPRDPHNVPDSFYRITLTVTDSSGLSSTDSVDVHPNLVEMTFTSDEPGATYTIDGQPHTETYTETGVVGVERVIGAPAQDGYQFDGWSDGGAQTHTITTPAANSTYTAYFTAVPTGAAAPGSQDAAVSL